jgi:hypothetical protein
MTGISQIAIPIPFGLAFWGHTSCVSLTIYFFNVAINAQLVLEAPDGVDVEEYQDQVDATLEAIEAFKEISSETPMIGVSFTKGFFQGFLAAADVDYDEDLVCLLTAIAN